MKALPTLDLLDEGPRRQLGWRLLGIGLAACVISGAWVLHRSDLASFGAPAQQALQVDAAPPAVSPIVGSLETDPVVHDGRTEDAWRLLVALDDAQGDRAVQLLALQPLPDGQRLRASLQAADLPSMRRWLLALTARPPFAHAVLIQHEWRVEANPKSRALHFEVEVEWPAQTASLTHAVQPRSCS